METITTESRRQQLQITLDAERSSEERNKLGQFATPHELAAEIAGVALKYLGDRPIRFMEPAVGSGAFYSALLATCPAGRIKRAFGFKLDPRFVEAARTLWADSGLIVTPGDFTSTPTPTSDELRATLILANPPYVRHHHLERAHKLALQARAEATLDARVSGLTGLYVYFIILAHGWMSDDAVAAWLVPTEWMDVNYGASLKEYLCSKVQLLRVHRFDAADVQFGDALVSSSIIFFRKATPPAGGTCEMTVGRLTAPTRSRSQDISGLRHALKWSPYFQPLSAQGPATSARCALTLSDLLMVKRGIATGDNAFFIRPRAEFARRGIPRSFLRPVLPSSRHLTGDVIGRAADGYPDLEEPLALLDCNLSESEIKARYPNLWHYLESEPGQEARRGYLARGRRLWYAQEHRPNAPVVSTYMGRGRAGRPPFRFFWNQSEATATNVYLLLIPKPKLAALLQETPALGRVIVDFLVDTDPVELLGHGRVYGGGLHKLEPKELGRLNATKLAERLGLDPGPRASQTRLPF